MPTPESIEAQSVRSASKLADRMSEIGARGLLFAGIDWDKLFKSGWAPGALPAPVARATMTRTAIRRNARQRQSFRAGRLVLLNAIQVAGVS